MPYQTVGELPPTIRASYSPTQQAAFLSAFNSALDAGQDESAAFAIAHHAAGGEKGFKLFANGRWLAWYTNPYLDRDGEYFAEKAIEQDIAYMQEHDAYPELWFYHEPIRLGQADFAVKLGRFGIAMGYVDDNPVTKAIVNYAVKEGYKLSHGFTYDPLTYRDHTYNHYHTYEISLVPSDEAANSLTMFNLEGDSMKATTLSPKVRDALVKALEGYSITPEELADNAKAASAKADAALGWKVIDNLLSLTADKAVDEAQAMVDAKMPAVEIEAESEEEAPVTLRDIVKAMGEMNAKFDGMKADLDTMRGVVAKADATEEAVKTLAEAVKGRATSAQEAHINSAFDDYLNRKLKATQADPMDMFGNMPIFGGAG